LLLGREGAQALRTAWSPITRGTLFWPPSLPRLLSHAAKPPGGIGSITAP
jgi:hypothetical protein